MNLLLVLLCMAGWALYIVHTNDRGDNLAAQNPKFSEELSPAAQALVDSIPSELQPIPATAVRSPHAITPDVMPRQVIANAPAPAPQMQPSESPNALQAASQDSAPGWISMAYLGPADAVENTAPKNTEFKTKPMPKVA